MEPVKYKRKLKTVQLLARERPAGPRVSDSDIAHEIVRAILKGLDQDREHFVLLALDCRGRTFGFHHVATGTATGALVHPREVFRPAILLGAAGVILAHNHPSGDPDPSTEDYILTARLADAGDLLGIPVYDHLVIGFDAYRSILPTDANVRAFRQGDSGGDDAGQTGSRPGEAGSTRSRGRDCAGSRGRDRVGTRSGEVGRWNHGDKKVSPT